MILVVGSSNIVRFLKQIRPRGKYAKTVAQSLFALGSFVLIVLTLTIIPLVLYREFITTGRIIENKVEKHFECSLVAINEMDMLPHCTEKITGSNFLKQTIKELR